MANGSDATQILVQRALGVGAEILRLMQAPLSDEALSQLEAHLAGRESLLKEVRDAAAADRSRLPDPQSLRLLTVQQQALEEQARRAIGTLQESSGEMRVALSSMQAVHRILNPGVRPRLVDERR